MIPSKPDDPSLADRESDDCCLRPFLADLVTRVDQVRSALASERRALDDQTLLQILDVTAAKAALTRSGPELGESAPHERQR